MMNPLGMISHHARQAVKQPSNINKALPLPHLMSHMIVLHAVLLKGRHSKLAE